MLIHTSCKSLCGTWADPNWERSLIACIVFNALFQLYRGGQCTYPCFPGVLLIRTPHNILSKPLAAFPQNLCRNNGQQWERNESCRNDYHQSWILAEPGIEPATSCSQVRLSYGPWRERSQTVKLKKAQVTNFVLDKVENIVRKGDNAGYQHFLLFPQCFQ